jgi:predicted N-acetyltransferase YhbS
MLAVDPVLQGQGIGQLLLRHDLRNIDQGGSISWLLSLAGLERFYSKFGFRETVKVESEEMGDWKGGMIMLRD